MSTPQPQAEAKPEIVSPRASHLEPEVKWDSAATVLCGMGMGFLLPWNAFMLAADYFEELYPGEHAESTFASANKAALLGCMFVMLLYGTKMPVGFRTVFGFAVLLASLLLAIPTKTMGMHVFLVITVGLGDALTQGSVYGFAGQLSPLHTGAVMMGNGASGFMVSGLRLITKAMVSSLYGSFALFFLLCGVQIAACIAGWFVLRRMPAAAHLDSSLTKAGWAKCFGGTEEPKDAGVIFTELEDNDAKVHADDSEAGEMLELAAAQTAPLEEEKEWMGINTTALKRVFLDIRLPGGMVFLNFATTLAVFPGVTVEMQSSALGNWYPVLLITIFNGTDMLGRIVASYLYCAEPPSKQALVRFTCARLIMVPFFIVSVHPRWLTSATVGFILLAAFGVSNGFVATQAMVLAPTLVPGESDKEIASMEMVFLLMCGLSTGALIGSALQVVFDATGGTLGGA